MDAGVHATEAPASVDVLFFRIGEARYGADASQVLRIDRAGFQAKWVEALGMPREGGRALVFHDARGEEAQLCVDEVVGVRPVSVHQLRRVPPAAGQPRGVIGFWLDEGQAPVVLIDLPASLDAPKGQ
ncbi:MAG: Frizzy aggregation protein FrzB [Myxococcaceae bacterium]|nr:Frizzy aggregation protein FrzB [Myxococcaceae bacterium]